MAQTLFKAAGLTPENADALKDAGMAIAGVRWVNINNRPLAKIFIPSH